MLPDVWMRDPYIYLHTDGNYYLTYTNSKMNMPVWKSTDLENWEMLGESYSMDQLSFYNEILAVRAELDKSQMVYYDGQLRAKPEKAIEPVKLWAPEIYNFNNKWYAIHTSNSRTSVLLSSDNITFDKIDEPMGNQFGQHHDPSIFQDTDGTLWLVDKCATVTKLKSDLSGFDGKSHVIAPADRKMGHEGCQIIKIGDKYVWFGTAWSEDSLRNGTYNLHYATADKITGPYSERRFAGYCLGHGTVFQDKNGDWWCTAFLNGQLELTGGLKALTINKQGLTIVPISIEERDGDVEVKALDPRYAYNNTEKKSFTYCNPISQGIDPNGIRDCQVFRDGNWWYMTATARPHWSRQEIKGNLNEGVPLYRSNDLKSWSFIDYIVKRPEETSWYYRRFWAPEVHFINGKYYATFNCSNPDHGYAGQWMGLAVADEVAGPYTVLTEDKPLGGGNDLTLYQDDDGTVYGFYNRGKEFGIGFCKIDLEKGEFVGEHTSCIRPEKVDFEYNADGTIVQTPGYDGRPIDKVAKYYDWDSIGIEGAYVIKRGDIYYLFYSSWTRGYEIGYATASSIQGPWTKADNNPIYGAMSKAACERNGFEWSGDENSPFNQVGHNEIFTGPDGRIWLSCHGIMSSDPESPMLVIDPLDFDEDGKVIKKVPTYTPQTVTW